MSVIIDGNKNPIVFSESFNGTLTEDHSVLYIAKLGEGIYKLGQLTTHVGKTPVEALQISYANEKRASTGRIYAEEFFVFDKKLGITDIKFRQEISNAGIEGLDACYGNLHQVPGYNYEALIGYNSEKHLEPLKGLFKKIARLTVESTLLPFVHRYGQKDAVDEIMEGFEQSLAVEKEVDEICKTGTVKGSRKRFKKLLAAFGGFGKTVLSIVIAHRLFGNSGGFILLTTPAVDTINNFVNAVNKIHFGKSKQRKTIIYTKDDLPSISEIQKEVATGNIVILALSVQDLRYQEKLTANDIKTEIRSKYKQYTDLATFWIRDEYHSNYNGVKTSEIFKDIKIDNTLDLTATPYHVMHLYAKKDIVIRDIFWALENWKDTKVPRITINALTNIFYENMGDYKDMFSIKEGFNGKKMFARDKQTRQFKYINMFKWLLKECYCTNFVPDYRKPFSINNDSGLSDVAKNIGLWILPEGANGITASEYITELAEILNKDHEISKDLYITTSYDIDKNRGNRSSVEDCIEGIIKERPGKKIVILTHRKFLTGTDIPKLGHEVWLDNINSFTLAEQALLRLLRVSEGKEFTKIYIFPPGVKFCLDELIWAAVSIKGGSPEEKRQRYKDYRMCFPIQEYVDKQLKVITADESFGELQKRVIEKLEHISVSKDLNDFISNKDNINSIRKLAKLALKGSKGHGKLTTVDITENNGSETFDTIDSDTTLDNDANAAQTNNNTDNIETTQANITTTADTKQASKTDIDNFNKIIDEIFDDLVQFAFTGDTHDVIDNLEKLRWLYDGAIDVAIEICRENEWVKDLLQYKINDICFALSGLPPEEVYDKLFKNSKRKAEKGLVYTPFALSYKVIAETKKSIGDKQINTIVVINALHGSFPIILKKEFPNANIICAECSPLYADHLTRQGFRVIMYNTWRLAELTDGHAPTKDEKKELAKFKDEEKEEFNNLPEEEKEMLRNLKAKADVVIGNPPYQNKTDNKWDKEFYKKFVYNAMSLTDKVMAFIIPDRWTSLNNDQYKKFSDDLLNTGLVYYKRLPSNAFSNVQMNTCVIITSKWSDLNTTVESTGGTSSINVNIKALGYYPVNFEAINILAKLSAYKGLVACSGSLYENALTPGTHKIVFRGGKTGKDIPYYYGSTESASSTVLSGTHKVVVSRNAADRKLGPVKVCDSDAGVAMACFGIATSSVDESIALASYMDSKIVKFLVYNYKNGTKGNSKDLFSRIPAVPLHKTWTDTELYAYFGLTQEEIDYIEKTMK